MLLLVFAPEKKKEAHGDKEKRPIGVPLSGNKRIPLGEQKIATDQQHDDPSNVPPLKDGADTGQHDQALPGDEFVHPF